MVMISNLRHTLSQSSDKILLTIKILILCSFVFGNILQLHTGMADNGDFTRAMTWVTTGPKGFVENWPPENTPEWSQRFFSYWIPQWDLKFSTQSILFSSTVFLWLPGALINYLFFSPSTLLITYVSFMPRLLCLLFLLGVFYWIDHSYKRHRLLLYLTMVLPLVLMFTTTDYNAYFNSFYQETGSMVYFLVLIVLLFMKKRFKSIYVYAGVVFVTLFLLVTAKPSNLYWTWIAFPFLFDLKKVIKKPILFPVILVFLMVPTYIAYRYCSVPSHAFMFESIFSGSLKFSQDPLQRLKEIGINDPEALNCMIPMFNEEGYRCYNTYRKYITIQNNLTIIAHEPLTFFRQIDYFAQHFQKVSVGLVKYPYGDHIARYVNRMNLWSYLKENYFPRGWVFWVWMTIGGGILLALRKIGGFPAELWKLGEMLWVGCLVDILIAMVGAGTADMVKHMFFANYVFDLLWILMLNVIILIIIQYSLKVRIKKENISD